VETGRIIQKQLDSIYILELLQLLKSQECFTKIDYTELTVNLLLLTQKVVPVRLELASIKEQPSTAQVSVKEEIASGRWEE